MKSSLRNYSLCRGDDSVATISSSNFRLRLGVPSFRKQQRISEVSDPTVDEYSAISPSLISSYTNSIMMSSEDDHDSSPPPPLSLEEMLAQVDEEEEEEASAATQLAELMALSSIGRRMSCVTNSDILRSAKNALNIQYPRFSVDGRDVAGRGSTEFSLLDIARKPADVKKKSMDKENSVCDRPKVPQGFREPCLLERLMGLESMPLRTPPCNKSITTKGSANCYNDRAYMVKQQKPCRSLLHGGLLNEHSSHKSDGNVFGFHQKNRVRKQSFGEFYSAAASSSYSYSYKQSNNVQASFSSSKARELLMKKQKCCTAPMKVDDKKKEKKIARV